MTISKFLLTIFFTSVYLSYHVLSLPSYRNLRTPSVGARSFAFDSCGRGPYTGVSDGRIILYKNSTNSFVNFAYTSPNRTSSCDRVNNVSLAAICGRALSMEFYHHTKQLYIADASLGLFVVGPKGGKAKQLATESDGIKFRFTVGLEVDQSSGIVYFTDASTTAGIDNVPLIIAIRDATGRLLKYNPRTKKVTTLLSEISGAAAVAISEDGSYLLIAEFIGNKIRKYWLKGPKAKTVETIMNVDGFPDSIRRTESGDFWVAVSTQAEQLLGLRINGFGTVLETLNFTSLFNASSIAEVQQYKDSLYLGSFMGENLGVYRL